jgi:cytochrome P450
MTLAWCWSLLSRHPEVAARLNAELDTVLEGRTPTVEDLPKLAYVRRVIEETLRLYPPAWVIPRQSHGPDEIGGFAIAGRAAIFISPYVTHRHPEFWENPEGFDPDRFLPERSAGRPRYAYFPFGGGMRMCIGREFALVEAQLVLATLARRFRPELVPGHLPVPDPILTLRPKGPVPMTLRGR